jgi:hypothetical protein
VTSETQQAEQAAAEALRQADATLAGERARVQALQAVQQQLEVVRGRQGNGAKLARLQEQTAALRLQVRQLRAAGRQARIAEVIRRAG